MSGNDAAAAAAPALDEAPAPSDVEMSPAQRRAAKRRARILANGENRMKLVTGENDDLVQVPNTTPTPPKDSTDTTPAAPAPKAAAVAAAAAAATPSTTDDFDAAADAFFEEEGSGAGTAAPTPDPETDDEKEGLTEDPEVEEMEVPEETDDRPRWQRRWANTSAATLAAGQHPVLSIPSPRANKEEDDSEPTSELRQRRGDREPKQQQQQQGQEISTAAKVAAQQRTGFGSSWTLEGIVQVLRVVLVVALGVVTGVRWGSYVLASTDCRNFLPASASEADRIARYGSNQAALLDSDVAISELAHGLREGMPLPLLGESVMLSLAAAAMLEQLLVRGLRRHVKPKMQQMGGMGGMGALMGGGGGMGAMVLQAAAIFGGPNAVIAIDTGKQVVAVLGAVTHDSALAFLVTVLTASVTMMLAEA